MSESPGTHDEIRTVLAAVTSRARADEVFRSRLRPNPSRILRLEGLELPANVEVRVVDSAHEIARTSPDRPVRFLMIPADDGELDGPDLASTTGEAGDAAFSDDRIAIFWPATGGIGGGGHGRPPTAIGTRLSGASSPPARRPGPAGASASAPCPCRAAPAAR